MGQGLSTSFLVSRGTRQGSCLSPSFFNVFIDGLPRNLGACDAGFRFGKCKINHLAYADDLTLVSATVPGMQLMLDMCQAFADEWRFSYNPLKSQCTVISKRTRQQFPVFHLNGKFIPINPFIEILGCVLSSSAGGNVDLRIGKCWRAFYRLRSKGLSFPGLDPVCKAYLWNTACQPVLTYSMASMNYTRANITGMGRVLCALVKQFMGLPGTCHHSGCSGRWELTK